MATENKREIKFRAWDKETKQTSLVRRLHFERSRSLTNNCIIISFGELEGVVKMGNGQSFELMQYTGFKLAGKDVYEGDIIRAEYDGEEIIGEVFYENLRFDIDCEYDPECNILIFLDANNIGEVIGNIYENPELLNK